VRLQTKDLHAGSPRLMLGLPKLPPISAPLTKLMSAHEFTISAGDLDSGGRQYVFPIRAAWIRGALEDHEATAAGPDGAIDVRASASGSDVVIHGTVKASLVAPCARCLEPVAFEVDEVVSVLYAPGPPAGRSGGRGASKGRSEEQEISPEEADTLPYDGETVVLDDLVRDELILQTPSFPLCSEDCPGMSPSLKPRDEKSAATAAVASDVDQDVDPRLLPLRRLMDPQE
jgi:uncharacterized protein